MTVPDYVGYCVKLNSSYKYVLLTADDNSSPSNAVQKFKGYMQSDEPSLMLQAFDSNSLLNGFTYSRTNKQHAIIQPNDNLGQIGTSFPAGQFIIGIGKGLRGLTLTTVSKKSKFVLAENNTLLSTQNIFCATKFNYQQLIKILNLLFNRMTWLTPNDVFIMDNFTKDVWHVVGI